MGAIVLKKNLASLLYQDAYNVIEKVHTCIRASKKMIFFFFLICLGYFLMNLCLGYIHEDYITKIVIKQWPK